MYCELVKLEKKCGWSWMLKSEDCDVQKVYDFTHAPLSYGKVTIMPHKAINAYTCIHSYRSFIIHNIHSYIHTIQTFIHTCTHTYIHTYIRNAKKNSIASLFGYPFVPWWSDICSGDNCSCNDISDNKELEWG